MKIKIDGRWFLAGSHILLLIISLVFFKLQRDYFQILFGLSIVVIAEYIFFKTTSKYRNGNFRDRSMSAISEGAGLLILLKSHFWWFYGVMSFLTIAIKYLIRRDESRHLFNPTNGAIVLALTFFPAYWFEARTDDFMLSWYPMLHVTLLGLFATIYGKTWLISLSYILSILIAGKIFYSTSDLSSFVYTYGPEFGAIGLIYLWLMITDPKTAPEKYIDQIIYAFLIAFIHMFLRSQSLLYSRYISLFIVTIVFYLKEIYLDQKSN